MSAQTETIEITGLPAGTREAIKKLSQSKGKSADEYLRTLIEAEIPKRPLLKSSLLFAIVSDKRNDRGTTRRSLRRSPSEG